MANETYKEINGIPELTEGPTSSDSCKLDEICDHLNDIAPEGLEFGAQEGDDACFGFWKIAEEEN